MKKEIREIEIINGEKVYQITTLDSRWYVKSAKNTSTGLPEYKFYPSSTWIASYYPKGVVFYKWLANKGWEEAEAIKVAAGERGSKVHYTCAEIDAGKEVAMDTKYPNPNTGIEEELTPDEYKCVMVYSKWVDEVKPELIANEITAFNEEYKYAGTIDKIFRIDGQIYVVDIKTGQSIWTEWELQISSYSHLDIDLEMLGITQKEWENRKLAILQLGYRLNKKRIKFTEIQNKFALFITARSIWENENPEAYPNQASYPLVISSSFRKAEEEARQKKVGKVKK